MKNARPYNIAFTPAVVDERTDTNGKPYLYARGTMTIGGKTVERTAMARGKAMAAVQDQLAVGEEIRLFGKFESGTAGEGESAPTAFAILALGREPKAKAAA